MRSLNISAVKFLAIVVAMFMLSVSTFAQVSVTLPTVSGVAGSEKLGAVTVGDLTGQNVTAFQFTVFYDKDVVEITGVETENTLVAGNAPTVNADVANGQTVIAWASATPLTGSGTLLNLKFEFKDAGASALNFGTPSTFMFNAGSPAAAVTNGSAVTPAVLIQGGTVSATAGDVIMIPITTTAITEAQNVISYDFTASFNPAVFTLSGYEVEGTLSANGSVSINYSNTTGTVALAWASADNITGQGTLIYLKGTAVAAGTSSLTFNSILLNAGTPITAAEAGSVVVTSMNVPPTITLNPAGPLFSVNEAQTLTIQLVGADGNAGDVLTYSATNMPAGATLNSTTGLFTWTPAYKTHGSYTVTFRVTDQGGLFASVNAAIMVVKTNRAPVFTKILPAGQIVPVHNVPVAWNFEYLASDPDDDNVIFSLVEGPAGSSITSAGMFTWVPTVDQAGKAYLVTIRVSDGALETLTSEVLAASSTITGVEDFETIPNEFVLLQNYPNPFNPSTSIQFGLPKESFVRLSVFNILGQEVGVLLNKNMGAGFHKVNFDASNLNTGMYIYKIEANDFVSVKKMLFVK